MQGNSVRLAAVALAQRDRKAHLAMGATQKSPMNCLAPGEMALAFVRGDAIQVVPSPNQILVAFSPHCRNEFEIWGRNNRYIKISEPFSHVEVRGDIYSRHLLALEWMFGLIGMTDPAHFVALVPLWRRCTHE